MNRILNHLILCPFVVLWGFLLCGCQKQPSDDRQNVNATASGPESSTSFTPLDLEVVEPGPASISIPSITLQFQDVAQIHGIDFVYDRGARGEALMSEATGGGAGWLDYDLDGFQDLMLVQGGNPVETVSNPSDQLLRQVSVGKFMHVPATKCGLMDTRYGQGISIADYDNDGFDDVYITNIGKNQLWRNQGDGTFLDVTKSAAMEDPELWSTSCAWGDLNQDGNLDLFVCNYLNYDPAVPVPCFDSKGKKSTCDPNEIDPVPNDCFLNLGDGRFEQVAISSGLRAEGSKSLGIVIADFDQDLRPDIFIANDTTSNFLFMNQGDMRFQQEAIERGCAISGLGQNQASMGVALGDYNQDGWFDLYVTHFEDDSNTLYENLGGGYFRDSTRRTAIHLPTLPHLGFGSVMADFNLDGRQDLFVTNGHIDDWRSDGKPWKMPPQVFSFVNGRWQELSRNSGDYFSMERLGRAVASADFDRDGDLDLVIVNQDDPAALLSNLASSNHRLQISPVGRTSNRTGIGVRVTVRQDQIVSSSELAGGTSYCSSHQYLASFGLGQNPHPCQVTVLWPSGTKEVVEDVAVDQRLIVIEGGSVFREAIFNNRDH